MIFKQRPRIGITKPATGEHSAYALIALAVVIAGGRAITLTTDNFKASPPIDGLILGGGQDIFPMLFDDTPKQSYVYDKARDELEISLAKLAINRDVPVLGICRGAQLLNVVCGGSLHLDTNAAYEDAHYPDSLFAKIFFRKSIETTPGSHIRAALQARVARVNSLHKQSMKRLGENLTATAVERNGVIQAIEDPDRSFVVGVQFHPEFMLHRAMFRRVFACLVQAARQTPSLSASLIETMIEHAGARWPA